jgi:hypothetical protein
VRAAAMALCSSLSLIPHPSRTTKTTGLIGLFITWTWRVLASEAPAQFYNNPIYFRQIGSRAGPASEMTGLTATSLYLNAAVASNDKNRVSATSGGRLHATQDTFQCIIVLEDVEIVGERAPPVLPLRGRQANGQRLAELWNRSKNTS